MKAAYLASALFLAVAAQAATVTVTGGTIRGQDLPDGSAVYRAIPFAAPPVGDLRWKPPAPVIPWSGVRNAVNAPRPCVQLNEGWNAAAAALGSEDCLYLSVHTPKHKPGDRLPVFVWIHGGSNRAGSGYTITDSTIYKKGIVLVGIEYRMGVFGFLASPELTAESPRQASGNYGLMDQIAAIRWVRNNIAQFGGDPGSITIGGQSAGGIDVGALMRSPLAGGLFAKAIQESGALGAPQTAKESEKLGSDLMHLLGLPDGAAGLQALRAVPADNLLEIGTKLRGPDGDYDSLWIRMTADGWVLPGNTNNAYLNGEQAAMPLLIGNNTREFVIDGLPDGGQGLIRMIFKRNAEQALAFYGFLGNKPPPDDPVLGSAATQVITDLAFRCTDNQLANWEVAKGQKVWRYQFGVPEPGLKDVRHNAELKYVFGSRPEGADYASWPPVQEYWANFIKRGDPNGAGLPEWPAFGEEGRYIAFMPTGIETGTDLRGPICRLMADTMRNP